TCNGEAGQDRYGLLTHALHLHLALHLGIIPSVKTTPPLDAVPLRFRQDRRELDKELAVIVSSRRQMASGRAAAGCPSLTSQPNPHGHPPQAAFTLVTLVTRRLGR
ncbi:MAG: hypothetical protein ACI83Y_002744, partial [Candidatus Azotimanducaceae bacterium]